MMNCMVIFRTHRYNDMVISWVYGNILAVHAKVKIVTCNIDAVNHGPRYYLLERTGGLSALP